MGDTLLISPPLDGTSVHMGVEVDDGDGTIYLV